MMLVLVLLVLHPVLVVSVPKWDFLLFTQQWPGAWKQPPPPEAQGFTIHGLWPNNNDTTYPEGCQGPAFDYALLAPILPKLHAQWGSFRGAAMDQQFWAHEWNTHGKCAQQDLLIHREVDYFKAALAMNARTKLFIVLQQANVIPSSKPYTADIIEQAFHKGLGVVPLLQCVHRKGRQLLSAVKLCYDQQLQLFDCNPAMQHKENHCGHSSQKVYYLPYKQLEA
eukprot:NODE_4164_length_832_cov_22.397163_g4006_i0.p2 GENE.NODE_4164_length_832_cov_22.397163_g4006_i0~~NODE_4164_length_832_cov_22.397163_g4006_i0.p2  ORF type:complete len:234 (+),score=101.66 NODE_4164_length_832_cov_22.397163_g4006_i0:32-703(+)